MKQLELGEMLQMAGKFSPKFGIFLRIPSVSLFSPNIHYISSVISFCAICYPN